VSLILTDTTVLNNFSQVARPDLLRRAFPSLAAPDVVRNELAAGERLGLVPVCDWSWLTLVALTEAEQSRADDLSRRLQAGEAACLAITEVRGGLVLTDDSAARRLAVALRLETSGTLGTLARLVRREILTLAEGDTLLAQMVERGYRSPVRSLREISPP
jgi:predicted nucleic acid-binding protein